MPTPKTVVTLNDAEDDAVDENDRPVDVPGYADIVEVAVKSEGDDWLFSIFTRSDLTWRDPFYEPLWYGFLIDTNRDGDPDYHLSLENDDERGQWAGGLFDVDEIYFYADDEFPGVALPIGASAVIRIEADALGDPSLIQAAATIERQVWIDPTNDPFNRRESYDTAPAQQWPDDDPDWIVVRRR